MRRVLKEAHNFIVAVACDVKLNEVSVSAGKKETCDRKTSLNPENHVDST